MGFPDDFHSFPFLLVVRVVSVPGFWDVTSASVILAGTPVDESTGAHTSPRLASRYWSFLLTKLRQGDVIPEEW